MGKSFNAPPAPDYAAAAQQQSAANLAAARATAMLSNPNVYTPFGSQTVSYEGDIPTIRQELTPDAMATVRAQQGVSRGLADLGLFGIDTAQSVMGTPFQYNGPDIQTSLQGLREMPVNAGMTGQEAVMSRLEPQFARQEASLRQQLANQGIAVGTEAANREMDSLNQRRNDAYTQAAVQGLNLDMDAQNQQYNQLIGQAGFGNTAAGQALQQQLALRNIPLNEITALMSGAQVQIPQFQNYQGATVGAAPVFQAAQAQNQYNMDVFSQKQAQNNAITQGLFSLAAAPFGMFSFGGGG